MQMQLFFVTWLVWLRTADAAAPIKGAIVDFQVALANGVFQLEDVVRTLALEPIAGEPSLDVGPTKVKKWAMVQAPTVPSVNTPFPFIEMGDATHLYVVQAGDVQYNEDQWTLYFSGAAGPPLDDSANPPSPYFASILGAGDHSCPFCFIRYEAGNILGLYLSNVIWRRPLPHSVFQPHWLTIARNASVLSIYQNGDLVDNVDLMSGSFDLFAHRVKSWYGAQDHWGRVLVHRLAASSVALSPDDSGALPVMPPTPVPTGPPTRYEPTGLAAWILLVSPYGWGCLVLAALECIVFLVCAIGNPFRSDSLFFTTLLIACSAYDNIVVGVGAILGEGDILTTLSYVRFFAHRGLISFLIVVSVGMAATAGFRKASGRLPMVLAYLASVLIYEGFMPPLALQLRPEWFLSTLRLIPSNEYGAFIESMIVFLFVAVVFAVMRVHTGEVLPLLGSLAAILGVLVPSSIAGTLPGSIGEALLLFSILTSKYVYGRRPVTDEEQPLLA